MMGAPSGLAAQVGIKTESVWGTAVVVDKFPEFNQESIKNTIARLESQGIRAGRLGKHTWRPGGQTIGGTLTMELCNKPLATFLTHMFGAVVDAGAGPYTHTATPGVLTGKSFTLQVGRPDTTGTVQPFTYAGCKIPKWTLQANAGQIATLALDISAKSEVTATALATVSQLSSIVPMTFVEGALTVAASPVAVVTAFTLTGDNGLKTDRFGLGSATVAEQLENGQRDYSGSFAADFVGLTDYNRYVNGTEMAMVLTFTSGADSLVVTQNVRYNGETPTVGGMQQLQQPISFTGTSATSDAGIITAVLTNTETVST